MKPLLSDHKTTNYLPMLASVIVLVQLGLLGASLLQWGAISRLAKQDDVYIQSQTGEVVPLSPVDTRLRQPEVMQAFTLRALMLLFNWPGAQPNVYGQLEPDKGTEVVIGDGETVRVPTSVEVSSFLIQPGLQEAMLKRIAEVVPRDYFSGTVEVMLVLDALTLPEQRESGDYQIKVVGHRYTVRNGRLPGEREPFNKVVTLQATDMPLLPVGETPLERKVYSVRQAGLMITDIRDISEDSSDV